MRITRLVKLYDLPWDLPCAASPADDATRLEPARPISRQVHEKAHPVVPDITQCIVLYFLKSYWRWCWAGLYLELQRDYEGGYDYKLFKQPCRLNIRKYF